MTTNTQLNLSKWHLADVTTSSKGQKTCVLSNEHKPMALHLGSGLRTRFGASSFDTNVESIKKNLDCDLTNHKQICASLKPIDDWAVEYMHTQSAGIFRKVMSNDVIHCLPNMETQLE